MNNMHSIMETIRMIDKENLDIRTITMGISLWIVRILMGIGQGKGSIVRSFDMPRTW